MNSEEIKKLEGQEFSHYLVLNTAHNIVTIKDYNNWQGKSREITFNDLIKSYEKARTGELNYITPLEALIIVHFFSDGLDEQKVQFLRRRCNSKTEQLFSIYNNLSVAEKNLIHKRLCNRG